MSGDPGRLNGLQGAGLKQQAHGVPPVRHWESQSVETIKAPAADVF